MGTAADDRSPGPALAREPARLLVPILAVGTVAAQYLLRSADDNRLTSWRWVFAETDPARLFAVVLAAVVFAHPIARLRLPGRRPGAVLFLFSYAVAACFWGEPEIVVDASRYFTQAKHLEVYGLGHFLAEWGRSIPAWTDLPLVPLLYGLVFRVFGESRVHVQVLTTLLFAGTVVLTYGVGKALWDDEVGFAGAAFLLGIPYLLTQVPSMLVDVPTMFFVTLAVFAAVHAFRHGGAGRILLASAAVFLALLSKYSAWLLLSVLPVAGVVLHRRGAPRAARTGALMVLIPGALLAAALLVHRDTFARQLALLLGYQAPGLRRWGESFLSTFLFQVHPFLTAAALLSVWMAIEKRDPLYAIAAWPVALLLVLQVRRIRYWVPAFPMFALMGAYGLQAIRASEVRKLVVACTVASSLAVALYGHLRFLERTSAVNLKHAGEFLDSIEEGRAEVLTPAQPGAEVNPAVSVPILDLFTKKRLVYSYEAPARPGPAAEESALRFTWEYRNPAYYAGDVAGGSAAVVVISGEAGSPLPEALQRRLEGLSLARVFETDEGLFRFRTLVRVYRAPSHGAAAGR